MGYSNILVFIKSNIFLFFNLAFWKTCIILVQRLHSIITYVKYHSSLNNKNNAILLTCSFWATCKLMLWICELVHNKNVSFFVYIHTGGWTALHVTVNYMYMRVDFLGVFIFFRLAVFMWVFFRPTWRIFHSSVYKSHLRGSMTLTPVAECIAVELSPPVLTT